jgi:hypothetical protein
LLVSHRRPSTHADATPDHELATTLGEPMAKQLLQSGGLDSTRPLVAFDVIEREDARGKQPEQYKLRGDRRIYEAVDSAVKAAMWWQQEDFQTGPEGFVTLNIPVCVFSIPFWDVCIDDGKVSEPERRSRGHQTNSYPTTVQKIILRCGAERAPVGGVRCWLDGVVLSIRAQQGLANGLVLFVELLLGELAALNSAVERIVDLILPALGRRRA